MNNPPLSPEIASGRASKNVSIASMVLGISSLLVSLTPVGTLLGAIAVILGIKGLKSKAGKNLALSGIITGSVGIFISLISTLLIFVAVPALQRNQDDTKMKNNISILVASIGQYRSMNTGAIPSEKVIISPGFRADYISNVSSTQNDISDQLIVFSEPSKDKILYVSGTDCAGNKRNNAYSLTTVLGKGDSYCIDD